MGGGSLEEGRLCAIRKGGVQCYGEDGRFGGAVLGLYEEVEAISGREHKRGCGDGSLALRGFIHRRTGWLRFSP